jgi:[acyl-carrier-protein] S-malonyltransferase
MKLAMVFPGQGSQSVGMLKAYAGLPEVDAVRTQAARRWGGFPQAARRRSGGATEPHREHAAGDGDGGIAAYRAWIASGGPAPAIVAATAWASIPRWSQPGALQFEAALPLVRFRAQAMQEAVPAGTGAMAAILGPGR